MSDNKILAKLKARTRVKKIEIFEEEVLIRLLTHNELKAVDFSDMPDEAIASFLSEQFLDVETQEKIFTPEELEEYAYTSELIDLIAVFSKANGSHPESMEQAEKN